MDKIDEKKQAERYTAIIESTADGILVLNSVRNNDNEIIDFRIEHCNRIGCELARFPEDAQGKLLLQMLPHLTGIGQFALHKQVVETGVPVQFETTFRNEAGDEYGWFMVFLQKLDDGVLSRFVDITEKRLYESRIESQAGLLNSILEASQHGIMALQAVRNENKEVIDFVFTNVNDRVADVLRLNREEIIGARYLTIRPETKESAFYKLKLQVLETGVPVEREMFYSQNGVDGWFNVALTKLGDDGLVQTLVDITESKRAKDRLSKIINTSRAGIFTLVPVRNDHDAVADFQLGLVNKMVENFLHMPEAEINGRLLSSLYPGRGLEKLFLFFKKTFVSGNPNTFEHHFGGELDMYFNVRVDKLEDELLVSFTDVTPLRKMQFRLQKTIEELRRSNSSLEEFTSAASHDLKEPIRKVNVLLTHLKMKYGDLLGSDPFKTFDKLEVATSRMVKLIDDLLEYSHLSYQRPDLEQVDLARILANVLEDLDVVVEEKRAVIDVGALPVVKGYPGQIQQLFLNLVSNGLKYSKADTPPVVTISATLSKGQAIGLQLAEIETNNLFHVIEVRDEGIGFDQKDAAKIFNVFERLHGNYKYKGSGVGLAIARKVMENHHGYITATGSAGQGAVFHVYFPVI